MKPAKAQPDPSYTAMVKKKPKPSQPDMATGDN